MKTPHSMSVLLLCISAQVLAMSNERVASLTRLDQLDLEELQRVHVKLDDVFDVFSGLVAHQKVSVASGLHQDSATAPAVTSLITAQDIEAVGARYLEDALEMVPGLHAGKRGSGYEYIYTMRGIHTNPSPEVLVLINGIPAQQAMDGRAMVDQFPVSLIQRIEVIRGPGSALYGANAFAGVINVITKAAQDIQGLEVGIRSGSHKTQQLWLQQGIEYGELDIAIMLDWERSDGHDALIEADAQTQFDQQFGTQASLAPGRLNTQTELLHLRLDVDWQEHWHWRSSLRRARDMGRGLGAAQALDPNGSVDSDVFSTNFTYHNPQLTPYWDVQTQISYQSFENEGAYTLYPAGAFGGAFPEGFLWNAAYENDELRIEANALYQGWKHHALRLGTGWQQSRLHTVSEQRNWDMHSNTGLPWSLGQMQDFTQQADIYLPTTSRKNAFVYLQDTWALHEQWEITAGLRYDDFSDFGNTTNPRFALVWKTTPNLTSKLLYGSAFRAPHFLEQNLNSPLLGLGNAQLKPETIDTWELAWDWFVHSDLHLGLNLFHYKIKDKIGFPGGQIQYVNAGEWEGQGLEWEARWKLSPYAAVLLNYAYQDSEDESGNKIADALRQSAYVRLDWMFAQHWFLDINSRWIAQRPRASNDWRSAIKDYRMTDVTLRYKHRQTAWNLALGARNIFDEDAREPTTVGIGVTHDLPLPGREWFAELRYRF